MYYNYVVVVVVDGVAAVVVVAADDVAAADDVEELQGVAYVYTKDDHVVNNRCSHQSSLDHHLCYQTVLDQD